VTTDDPTRRDTFTGIGLGGIAIGLGASPALARPAPPGARVDYADPETNMRLLVKLLGSLDGSVTYYHAHGTMFGMRPAQHARPLLNFEGCAARIFRPDGEGGFLFGLREWLLFKDPAGVVKEEWLNPYTLQTVKLPHFRGGGGMKHKWTVRGQERIGHEDITVNYGPQVYDWMFDGDRAVCAIDQFIAFPNPQQPDKFPVASTGPVRWEMQVRSFTTSRAALEDPALAMAPSIETWVMKNDWMGFMNMGQWSGHHMWRATGRKLSSLDQLPQTFRDETEARWPGHMAEFAAWRGA